MKTPRRRSDFIAILAIASPLWGCSGCGLVSDIDGRGGVLAVDDRANGTISPQDPAILLPDSGSSVMRNTDVWTIALTAGQQVGVAMCIRGGDGSVTGFDPLLLVESNGADSHLDDNSGAGVQGRGSYVTFTAAATATYQVYASEVTPGIIGDYVLIVTTGSAGGSGCPVM